MDSILNVEKEVEKVLYKFGALNDHTTSTLTSLINDLQTLHRDLNVLSSKSTLVGFTIYGLSYHTSHVPNWYVSSITLPMTWVLKIVIVSISSLMSWITQPSIGSNYSRPDFDTHFHTQFYSISFFDTIKVSHSLIQSKYLIPWYNQIIHF